MNLQGGGFYSAMLRSDRISFFSFTFCTVVCGSEWDICGLLYRLWERVVCLRCYFFCDDTSYNLFVCFEQIDLCLVPKYRSIIMYTIECSGLSVN